MNEGIYPDTSILNDTNNPFAYDAPSDDGKWSLQANSTPIAAFYSWATLNALTPNGEAQFYVGHDLEAIWKTSMDNTVRDHANRAYQAVLNNFPNSLTYDATGKIAYSLAALSCTGIIELNEPLHTGWQPVGTECVYQ